MLRKGPIAPNQYELTGDQFGSREQDPINLEAVFNFLKRNWKLIAVWMLIGVCFGIGLRVASTPYYTAHASLLLEDLTVRPFTDAVSSPAQADASFADSQVQVLQSKEVLGRVVDENNLTEDEEFGETSRGLGDILRDLVPFLSSPQEEVPADIRNVERYATILRVGEALSVSRVGVSNALDIAFTSRDPQRAALIANAVAQAYISSRLELKQRSLGEAVAQLRTRLDESRERAFNADQPIQGGAGALNAGGQARDRFREWQNTSEAYRALYGNLLQRYTEAVQHVPSPGARIISPAEAPLDRSWPPTLLLVAAGGIGGAALGFAHALVRYLTDRTLRDCSELHKATGYDCLAGIPFVKSRSWQLLGSTPDEFQEAYSKSSPAIIDAVSRIAVYLQSSRIDSSGSTVGIAALQDGNGASSFAAHLARVVAQSGQKTLLVDANWRQRDAGGSGAKMKSGPSFSTHFFPRSLKSDNLDVLVFRGKAPEDDLIASQSIMATLLRMRSEYVWIIVDFHAAQETADAAASGSLLDDLILVTESQRTTPDILQTAMRFLPREKISIVMNKVGG
ncbi:Wzz/FepE/Etk N-terminal domain-containing protein [Microvirga roseola]|uniref:Wzz/FepE/Etk N-terminal domain-containing protein n=1 Tax=Microvirga roseola TaxID=2883126 RepID=UPI001E4F6C05|nr:Wzz/FepE/Etk N-terminal domain-containing protein [Microvirga roseola]